MTSEIKRILLEDQGQAKSASMMTAMMQKRMHLPSLIDKEIKFVREVDLTNK